MKNKWIRFDEKFPEIFPCIARNYDIGIEDTILGIDHNNKAFKYSCFCDSLPKGMSMPFTHWKTI